MAEHSALSGEKYQKYIPIQKIEDLLYRAKNALKEESKIWTDRAEIETEYSKSLRNWANATRKKININQAFEHKRLRLGLMVALRECEATAVLHEDLANRLTDPNGPASNLETYRGQHFKSRFNIENLTPSSLPSAFTKSRVLQNFDTILDPYKSATEECINQVRLVQKFISEEIEQNKRLQKKKDKIRILQTGHGNSVYYKDQIYKREKDIEGIEGCLTTLESKREKSIEKANIALQKNVAEIDKGIRLICEWEADRITFVTDQIVLALEHIGILGEEAKSSTENAFMTINKIDADKIVRQWKNASIEKFKVNEEFQLETVSSIEEQISVVDDTTDVKEKNSETKKSSQSQKQTNKTSFDHFITDHRSIKEKKASKSEREVKLNKYDANNHCSGLESGLPGQIRSYDDVHGIDL